MKLEEFKAAIKGQKTIIISHWVGGSLESNKVMRNRTIEVSDLRVLPENGLVAYTFYTPTLQKSGRFVVWHNGTPVVMRSMQFMTQ